MFKSVVVDNSYLCNKGAKWVIAARERMLDARSEAECGRLSRAAMTHCRTRETVGRTMRSWVRPSIESDNYYLRPYYTQDFSYNSARTMLSCHYIFRFFIKNIFNHFVQTFILHILKHLLAMKSFYSLEEFMSCRWDHWNSQ